MVIVDNNVLSSLAKIDRLALLPEVFDDVATVSSVFDELHRDEVAGYDFVERIDDVKGYRGGWLEVRSMTEPELQSADEIVDSSWHSRMRSVSPPRTIARNDCLLTTATLERWLRNAESKSGI